MTPPGISAWSIITYSYFEKGCRTSARNNLDRYCGWFWVHKFSKKFERMAREAMDVCLRVLTESKKVSSTATVSGKVNWSYPILPFGIVACTCFSDNLSRNSCTQKRRELQYPKYGSTKVQFRIFIRLYTSFCLACALGYFNHYYYFLTYLILCYHGLWPFSKYSC